VSAAEALKAARAAGIEIGIDGDDLMLEASAPPSAAVLDLLLRRDGKLARPVEGDPRRGTRPMNADLLLKHYERIADAPDTIAHLRRFILDLAVRGKLVPQDVTDEPASELLKRIAAEKARLV
jgi:hypothetical protein